MALIEGLRMFNNILLELSNKNSQKAPKKLKFINHSMEKYSVIEKNLLQFFEINLSQNDYDQVVQRINDLSDESRLCELILELIRHSEEHMDRHLELFEEILQVVQKIQQMDEEKSKQFAESAIDKCCLLIYDSFQILRTIRKKIIELSKMYHIPYFYETGVANIRVRSSVLTTYKNLNTVMDDFSILNEALWYVRHYDYINSKSQTSMKM